MYKPMHGAVHLEDLVVMLLPPLPAPLVALMSLVAHEPIIYRPVACTTATRNKRKTRQVLRQCEPPARYFVVYLVSFLARRQETAR